jgi:hypothetical protein
MPYRDSIPCQYIIDYCPATFTCRFDRKAKNLVAKPGSVGRSCTAQDVQILLAFGFPSELAMIYRGYYNNA